MSADRLAEMADEIALGLVDEAEAEGRMAGDPALARAVGAARDRFLALDLGAGPVAPAAGAWEAVAARLGAARPAARSAWPAWTAAAANANAAPRAALAALLAVAATLAVAFLPFDGGRDARAVAVLEGGDGQVVALVEDFGRGRVEVTPLAEVAVARTESLQVWTKWSEEVGPVSVGLLDGFARAAFDGDLPAPVAGQLYEITREPRGGSPTGRPTGPVLALGLAAAP